MNATWEDLANAYDKNNSNRRARTLPMNTIFEWAEKQHHLFKLTTTGELQIIESPIKGRRAK